MSNYNDLTIIIPSLNEKINLETFIPKLFRLYPGCSILLADDGSDDGTREMAEKILEKENPPKLFLMDRKRKKFLPGENAEPFKTDIFPGLAASVCDAISVVKTENFAVIDADRQHPAELPGEMYEKLQDGDLVCAFRRDYSAMPLLRRLLSRAGNYLAHTSLPKHASKLKDPLSGAFAGRTCRVKKCIPPGNRQKGFKILFEILKRTGPDLKTAQTSYVIGKRAGGKSSLGFKNMKHFFYSLNLKAKAIVLGVLILSAAAAGAALRVILGG